MNRLPYLKQMKKDERNVLLRELYTLIALKRWTERLRETETKDAPRFRSCRKSLARMRRALSYSLKLISKAAAGYPKLQELELVMSGSAIREAIIRGVSSFDRARELLEVAEGQLAAMINPQLRTDSEKKLVRFELLEHSNVPLAEKTPKISHWFIGAAASRLGQFRTESGKPIPRYDKIIAHLFQIGLNDFTRTDESIRIELRRRKKKDHPSAFV